MGKFHEDSIGKPRKIAGYALSILFSIQIFMAAGTHVEHGAPPAPLIGIITAVLLYAGTFLRKPSILK